MQLVARDEATPALQKLRSEITHSCGDCGIFFGADRARWAKHVSAHQRDLDAELGRLTRRELLEGLGLCLALAALIWCFAALGPVRH